MPRSCTVCSHTNRTDIEGDLVRSEPLRSIAQRYGPTPWALLRHRKHMGAAFGEAQSDREESVTGELLSRLADLEDNAKRALARAERIASEEGQSPRVALEATRTALLALKEQARQVELMAKLRGEIRNEVTVNVTNAVSVNVVEAMPLEEREQRIKNALEAVQRQRERALPKAVA